MQRHFGPGFRSDGDLPLNFTSTPTAAENALFAAQDALCVIDDYFPRRSARDAETQDKLASLIARSVGNGQARERSRADLSQRASRPPRAVALVTAEVDPVPASSDESAANRTLKLHLRAGQVDKWVLSTSQQSPHHIAMRSFIEWLASDWNRTVERAEGLRAAYLVEMRELSDLQARQAEQIAPLLTAWQLWLDHAVDLRVLSVDAAERHMDRTRDALISLASTQTATSDAHAPEAQYLDTLRSLLTQGRAALVERTARLDSEIGKIGVGWRDGS